MSGDFSLRSGGREKSSKEGVSRRNRESWQVCFKNLHADKIFCFSKILLSLNIIGRINTLPCFDIGLCES